MSRVLVAGGTGFLGSNLCERLIGQGDTVYCMDNLSTGSANNVAGLHETGYFHFIRGNIAHAVPEVKVNQIYDLASPTAPGAYQADPTGTLEANIAGTSNLLKLATAQKATMLFTSSIRVTEPLEKGSPHTCYVEGKRQGEKLCEAYHKNLGTDVKIARLYNTYGPRMAMDDSRVVPQFIMRALRGDPLKIVGDGTQKDSFCYVDDMLDALVAYMNSDIKLGPIEFGYPIPISILELAHLAVKTVEKMNGKHGGWNNEFPVQWPKGISSQIIFNGIERSVQEMEIKKRRPIPDLAEARTRLGWEPKVPLEAGLMMLAEYYSSRLVS